MEDGHNPEPETGQEHDIVQCRRFHSRSRCHPDHCAASRSAGADRKSFSGLFPRQTSLFTVGGATRVRLWDSFEAGYIMGEKVVRRGTWKNLGEKISKRLWFLDSKALCTNAQRRTGLEDFGEPPIERPLEVLVD